MCDVPATEEAPLPRLNFIVWKILVEKFGIKIFLSQKETNIYITDIYVWETNANSWQIVKLKHDIYDVDLTDWKWQPL